MRTVIQKRLEYRQQWKKWHNSHLEQSRLIVRRSTNKFRMNHPSYTNWMSMMSRCYNPHNRRYKDYGGRGITVYDPWKIFSIYEKDFGIDKPAKGYTVDRIDNDGNYEPGNCRWLTRSENAKKRFE